jgi:integrase/recombinase XerD
MSQTTQQTQNDHLLNDAWKDFILSRKAMLCSPATIEWYQFTAGFFVKWIEEKHVRSRDVHAYLDNLAKRGLTDTTVHCHARAIRTFLRFCHSEGYLPKLITFQMPRLTKRRLSFLTPEEVKRVLTACRSIRDKTLVMLMVDTGIRRNEAVALNWGDIDISSGLIRVWRGKGGKSRSVVIGIQTRRVLLRYRRSVPYDSSDPVFVTSQGVRLKPAGLRMALRRIGERVEVRVSPLILRRTFATLSLRSGINPIHLQALMGHASLAMTNHYITVVDDDLIGSHQASGPIDTLIYK